MAEQLLMTRNLPVRHDMDVFVAGGGPAGIAAALAASRQGCSVFLAEGHTCFGGMGTAGMVPAFMQFADGVHFLAGGIGREVYTRLCEAGGHSPDDDPDNPYACLSIRAEVLKRVYDDLLLASDIDFALQTTLIGVEHSAPGQVSHAILSAKSGLFAVKAHVFIDCTGDGDLATWAGAPYEKGDTDGNMMPGTLCSLWAEIDWPAVFAAGLSPGEQLTRAFDDGVFTIPDRHLPGIWRVSERVGGGNIGHTFGVDGTDERSLTGALIWGRKLALQYQRFYQQYLKGYEQMELVGTGSLLGIRETRRILGDYLLCLQDFTARAVFDDEIGRYAYPVDIHASKPGDAEYAKFIDEFEHLRYGPGESYGIPYRTLTPRTLDNVLVAGRCISTDRYLQGSVRVMPGCFITGQAAGVAAALAAEGNTTTREISLTELQARLRQMGAYLPNDMEVVAAG
ncbi:MAG: FAD-dependent oxidoreductase [Armatimonadota bacterium]